MLQSLEEHCVQQHEEQDGYGQESHGVAQRMRKTCRDKQSHFEEISFHGDSWQGCPSEVSLGSAGLNPAWWSAYWPGQPGVTAGCRGSLGYNQLQGGAEPRACPSAWTRGSNPPRRTLCHWGKLPTSCGFIPVCNLGEDMDVSGAMILSTTWGSGYGHLWGH